MDQNVVRSDLLPETMALWVILTLAVFALAGWVACHWALKRYGSNRFNVWYRGLLSLPIATIASWLVMQALGRFMFLATPWSLFLGALVLAVAVEAVSAFYGHECARVPPRAAKALVALRMGAVVLAMFVLLQPVVIGERERTVRRRVLILIDDSASMHFKDGQMTAAEKADVMKALGLTTWPKDGLTRAEIIRQLVDVGGEKGFLKRTAKKYDVDFFRFANGAKRDEDFREEKELDAKEQSFRSVTDLTRALESAMKEIPAEELASVLVFTDGRHNGDAGVESVARKLGSYGVRVSTVVIGGTEKPFDISIAGADSPESVFLGDKVRFTVTVAATHANGRQSKVKLYRDKDLIGTTPFTIEGDDWRKEFKFTDLPAEKGVYNYRVTVDRAEGELFEDNNVRGLDVAVNDDRTNVLLVDWRPRWEYRYLRNLFYGRDKSVHLQDWLVKPDTIARMDAVLLPYANASRPFGESEAGGFPFNYEDWRKFDVIILGDLGEDILTPDVVESIRYCVERRGALLVLIAGSEHMPYSIRDQKLRDLIPVEYEPDGASHRAAPEEAFSIALAASGRGHTVMNQSSSSAENEEIWQNMPDFRWRLPVKGVKAGAEILAYARPKNKSGGEADMTAITQSIAATIDEDPEAALRRLEEMRGEQGRNSLVVASTRGKGKVLMINTDSMWRLRSKAGDHLHHRFWGQVMRWGAGEKLRAGNDHVRIGTDQLRYGAGEPVKAFVRMLDKDFNGMEEMEPRLVLRRPDGNSRASAYYPSPRPDANGFYECEISGCDTPGVYTLNLECSKAVKVLGDKYPPHLETSFVVVTAKRPAEDVDITSTRETAERIAKATGGSVLSPSEYVTLDDDFGGGSKSLQDRVEYQLWSLPPIFLLIVALLTAEWILRKRVSLT